MSDKNEKQENADESHDDIEYQFDDDSSMIDDMGDDMSMDAGVDPADAESAGLGDDLGADLVGDGVDGGGDAVASGASSAGGLFTKKRLIFGAGAILLLIGVYQMQGSGTIQTDSTSQGSDFFMADTAENVTETASLTPDLGAPTDTGDASKQQLQDDFLAELDATPSVEPEKSHATVVEDKTVADNEAVAEKEDKTVVAKSEVAPVKEAVVITEEFKAEFSAEFKKEIAAVTRNMKRGYTVELNKKLVALNDKRDKELTEAVNSLKRQDSRIKQEMTSRYDGKVAAFQREAKQNEVTIKRLESQVTSLQAALGTLNQQQALVTKNQKQIMYNQGMSFNASGEAITPGGEVYDQVSSSMQHATESKYEVQAIVPGRAWLLTKEGNTLTVAVGDSLPGDGIVVGIDVLSGVVTTSSGKILTY